MSGASDLVWLHTTKKHYLHHTNLYYLVSNPLRCDKKQSRRILMFDTAKSMLAGQIWTSLCMVCGCVHTQNRAMKCAGRKPMLLLRFVGELLLRLAERRLFGLLFQFPPRITRLELELPSRRPIYHLIAKLHSITTLRKRTQCFQ